MNQRRFEPGRLLDFSFATRRTDTPVSFRHRRKVASLALFLFLRLAYNTNERCNEYRTDARATPIKRHHLWSRQCSHLGCAVLRIEAADVLLAGDSGWNK
jgi:hypothetical protein